MAGNNRLPMGQPGGGGGGGRPRWPMGQHVRTPRPAPPTTTSPPPAAPYPTAAANTPPAGGWNHGDWSQPFYNPQSTYGGNQQPGAWASSGVGNQYFGENPETAWTRALGGAGVDPLTAKGQNLRGMWGQIYEGYKAAAATNPNLKIQEYVAGIDPNMLYNAQTQVQRGESPGRFAGRARTISRAYGG